jgi:hypothetical protein
LKECCSRCRSISIDVPINQDLWWLAADFHYINETLTKAFGEKVTEPSPDQEKEDTLANELPVMAGGPGVSSGAATSHGSSELCFSFLLLTFGLVAVLHGGIWEWSFSLRLCLVEVGSGKVCPNITRKAKSNITQRHTTSSLCN